MIFSDPFVFFPFLHFIALLMNQYSCSEEVRFLAGGILFFVVAIGYEDQGKRERQRLRLSEILSFLYLCRN